MKKKVNSKGLFKKSWIYLKPVFLSIVLMLQLLLFSSKLSAQNISVKGQVTYQDGLPVPGASVMVKGSTVGTIADDKGNFQISVSSKGTLIISALGNNNKEVKVGGKTTIIVSLTSINNALDEVVVVGYGTQKKRDITGSIVSIKESVFDEVPAINLTMALQGRAAGVDIVRTGVRPGSSGQIRIRGNRSLSGSNDALIIVDGFPFGGSINDLNVDDIANIDILKDASATAIWGSAGSNGVVIVTTKRGKIGKSVISFNTTLGSTAPIDQFPVFNGKDYKVFKDESKYGAASATSPTIFTPAELLGDGAGVSTNWQDFLYKKGLITTQDLSVSGGNDQTQYGIGASYLNQEGIMPLVGFERFSLRATIDQKIGKRIKIGLNTMNSLGYTDGDGLNPVYNTLSLSPLVSPYNSDGTVNIQPMIGHQDVGARLSPLTLTNPNSSLDRRRRLRTYNTLYGELQLAEGLKYKLNVQLDMRQDNYGTYRGSNTILTSSSSTPFSSNTASIADGESWNYSINHQMTYDKTIAAKHRINLIALYVITEDESKSSSFSGTGIPADYVQNTNFAQVASSILAGNGSYSRSGLLSYMGRLNYTFNDKYNLTATFRRDGSSRLAAGNKWFNYPALAASWNASQESFLKNSSWLSNLKMRVGWGISSSQSVPPYTTLGGLSSVNYNFGATVNTTGYYVSSLPNPALKWESTSVNNFGIDFAILKNRISGSIDIYKASTKDILVNKALPISNGANFITTNAANTESHGVEVILSTINLDTKSGFKWTTDINWSFNREKITALEEPGKLKDIGNGWFVGQPINVIYDFKKVGIWQTSDAATIALYGAPQLAGRIRVEDLNKDNKIDAKDMQVIGSAQPDWIGGITNRFSFKNFDLTAVAFARVGGTAIANYLQSNNGGSGGYGFFGQGRVNQWKVNYWTATNPTNEFPQPTGQSPNDNYTSTLGYYDGSFIRIRSISFGYLISKKLLAKSGINSARVFVSISNPMIVYSPMVRDGYAIDPEGTSTGSSLAPQGGGTAVPSRGIQISLNTPPTREIIFGINMKF